MANAERPDTSSEVSGRDVGEPFPTYANARRRRYVLWVNTQRSTRENEHHGQCLGVPHKINNIFGTILRGEPV